MKYQPHTKWQHTSYILLKQHLLDVQGHLECKERVMGVRENPSSCAAATVKAIDLHALPHWNTSGTEVGTEAGTEAGNKADTKTGNKADTKTGNKADTKTGNKADTKTGNKADTKAPAATSTVASNKQARSTSSLSAVEGQCIDVLANLHQSTKPFKQNTSVVGTSKCTMTNLASNTLKRKIDEIDELALSTPTSTAISSPVQAQCPGDQQVQETHFPSETNAKLRLKGFGSQVETPTRGLPFSNSQPDDASVRSTGAASTASSTTQYMEKLARSAPLQMP